MPKTPFRNSSRFSCTVKTLEYMSLPKNHESSSELDGYSFLEECMAVNPGSIYDQSFNVIHSKTHTKTTFKFAGGFQFGDFSAKTFTQMA